MKQKHLTLGIFNAYQMIQKLKSIFILIFLLIIFGGSFAQDVKSVDVKSLPQSDVKKAQQMMQDAGLSKQDAANLARQKGATEQQIQEFQNRIQENNSNEALNDSVQETSDQY